MKKTKRKEGEQVIVTKDGRHSLYIYKNEEELERIVVEHSSEIFGKNAHYFGIKKKIKSRSGLGTIPDGYVIDTDKNKLYVVEVELIRHNLKRHIVPQILNFQMALENDKTQEELVILLSSKANDMDAKGKKLRNREYIKRIVCKRWGIIIIIDDISEQLGEIVEFLSAKNMDVIAIPFKTFTKRSSFNKKDDIYSFTALTKKGLEEESKKWTFKWTTIPEGKHLDKLDDDSKIILKKLGEKICSISSDIKEVHRKSWITYQISKLSNFCTIKFPKGFIEIHMKVDKDKFTDKRGMTRDIQRTAAWTFDKVFIIKSKKDIDYAVSLIKQAYHCVCKPKSRIQSNKLRRN